MKERADRHMQQHIEANKVKELLGYEGYSFTMSLYAVIVNPETKLPEYRRVEVFIRGQPTEKDVVAVKNFFRELIPLSYYSIWAYEPSTEQIIQVESFK